MTLYLLIYLFIYVNKVIDTKNLHLSVHTSYALVIMSKYGILLRIKTEER